MRNVLAIQGSPRKNGSTNKILNVFEDHIQKDGRFLYKKHHLQDLDISPCIACNSCRKGDGRYCVHKDDMEGIYLSILEAEILILATPVYFAGMSSQMKIFLDRLYALTKAGTDLGVFRGKQLLLLITFGDPEPNPGVLLIEETFKVIAEALGIKITGVLKAFEGNMKDKIDLMISKL